MSGTSLQLTVTCRCGASGGLAVGEGAWTCPSCERQYGTSGVDTSEYLRVTHQLAVIKRYAWGGGAVILAVTGAIALVRPTALLAAPVLLAGYYFWYLPRYRRQLRAVYASLPEWRLSERA